MSSSHKDLFSDTNNVARGSDEEKKRCVPSEGTPLLSSQPAQSSNNSMTGIYCTCRKFADRKFLVDIFAILFGISAWVSINGMYVQLPLMVLSQPEGWSLPSYLAVIIQVANIGPILYSISQKLFPRKIKDSWIIYVILIFGTTASLLMGFFYYRTTFIAGSEHSTALFSLTFFGALVGCTSSVLFMPFMGNFREIYLISYFVGEGLSGFLPSVVALIQGVGGNPVCVPSATNSSVLVPYTEPPRFSTEAFYFFLFGIMTLSTISFFLLDNLKLCRSERTDIAPRSRAPNTRYSQTSKEGSIRNTETNVHNPIFTVREDVEVLMKERDVTKTSPEMHYDNENSTHSRNEIGANGDIHMKSVPQRSADVQNHSLSHPVYIYFLIVASWVCMFGNGIFPSIQSYSCLPYGNIAYHLSVTLGSMANPMACFLAFFYPYSSVKIITVLTALSNVIIVYILITAFLSPMPPLVNTTGGEVLVVCSWVIVTGLITYVKVSVASVFRREGGRALFWCGGVQQLGSAVGALLFFFLINFTKTFRSYDPCT